MTRSTVSLRTLLREATRPLHEAVDAAFAAYPLTERDGYAAFLAAHAAALFPVEEALEEAGVARLLDDWPQRSRRAALAADLAVLGAAPREPMALAPLAGEAECWGALYVLEGSRMGARLLARRVGAAERGLPLGYLRHGEQGDLWARFLWRLEAAAQRIEPASAVAGARECFAVFLRAGEGGRSASRDGV